MNQGRRAVPGVLPPACLRTKTPISEEMLRSRSILAAYAANSLLVFLAGTMMSWLPTYFNRVYRLSTQAASMRAAVVILAAGAGSALCGFLVGRLSRRSRRGLFLGSAAIAASAPLILRA